MTVTLPALDNGAAEHRNGGGPAELPDAKSIRRLGEGTEPPEPSPPPPFPPSLPSPPSPPPATARSVALGAGFCRDASGENPWSWRDTVYCLDTVQECGQACEAIEEFYYLRILFVLEESEPHRFYQYNP